MPRGHEQVSPCHDDRAHDSARLRAAGNRNGGGRDALNGLGRTLVGGLSTGTLLTLLLVPLFYSLIDDLKDWLLTFAGGLSRFAGKQGEARGRAAAK